MLEALREGTRGWIAWVIVGALCVPFALWGIGNYAGFVSPGYVAKVNGSEISQQDLSRAYRNRIGQLQQRLGADYTPDDPTALKKQVLNGLVNNRLLKLHAAGAGYRVGDQQLVAHVQAMPVFNVGGQFNMNVYQTRLRRGGYSPQSFENAVRQDMIVAQLRGGVAGSAIATDSEFNHFVALSREQRKIGYVKIRADQYQDQARPSEARIKDWYENHKKAFMAPDTVSVAYIELDAQSLAKQVSVDRQALKSFYQKKKESFVTAAQRRAAHILIAPEGDSDEAQEKAESKAESVLEKIQNGADFDAMAKKYSDDAGSSKKGGDLGWIQHGELAESFQNALFGADKVGAVVGPVKTQFGYHIIKLEGIRKPQQESFEQAHDKLVEQYRQKQAEDKFYKLGSQLSNLAFDHSDSLEPIQQALDLPIQHVSGVTRETGEGIAANPRIRNAVFSTEVYENGKNHLVELSDTHVVVLRDVDRQPAKLKPLDQVKSQIVKTLTHKAAVEKAGQAADEIAKKIDDGAGLSEAAGDRQAVKPAFVGRGANEVPAPVLKAAFKAPVPADDSSVTAGTAALDSGDRAVYVVAGVKPGEPASVKAGERQLLVRRLRTVHARADLAAYVSDLRKKADIDIQQQNINRY